MPKSPAVRPLHRSPRRRGAACAREHVLAAVLLATLLAFTAYNLQSNFAIEESMEEDPLGPLNDDMIVPAQLRQRPQPWTGHGEVPADRPPTPPTPQPTLPQRAPRVSAAEQQLGPMPDVLGSGVVYWMHYLMPNPHSKEHAPQYIVDLESEREPRPQSRQLEVPEVPPSVKYLYWIRDSKTGECLHLNLRFGDCIESEVWRIGPLSDRTNKGYIFRGFRVVTTAIRTRKELEFDELEKASFKESMGCLSRHGCSPFPNANQRATRMSSNRGCRGCGAVGWQVDRYGRVLNVAEKLPIKPGKAGGPTVVDVSASPICLYRNNMDQEHMPIGIHKPTLPPEAVFLDLCLARDEWYVGSVRLDLEPKYQVKSDSSTSAQVSMDLDEKTVEIVSWDEALMNRIDAARPEGLQYFMHRCIMIDPEATVDILPHLVSLISLLQNGGPVIILVVEGLNQAAPKEAFPHPTHTEVDIVKVIRETATQFGIELRLEKPFFTVIIQPPVEEVMHHPGFEQHGGGNPAYEAFANRVNKNGRPTFFLFVYLTGKISPLVRSLGKYGIYYCVKTSTEPEEVVQDSVAVGRTWLWSSYDSMWFASPHALSEYAAASYAMEMAAIMALRDPESPNIPAPSTEIVLIAPEEGRPPAFDGALLAMGRMIPMRPWSVNVYNLAYTRGRSEIAALGETKYAVVIIELGLDIGFDASVRHVMGRLNGPHGASSRSTLSASREKWALYVVHSEWNARYVKGVLSDCVEDIKFLSTESIIPPIVDAKLRSGGAEALMEGRLNALLLQPSFWKAFESAGMDRVLVMRTNTVLPVSSSIKLDEFLPVSFIGWPTCQDLDGQPPVPNGRSRAPSGHLSLRDPKLMGACLSTLAEGQLPKHETTFFASCLKTAGESPEKFAEASLDVTAPSYQQQMDFSLHSECPKELGTMNEHGPPFGIPDAWLVTERFARMLN